MSGAGARGIAVVVAGAAFVVSAGLAHIPNPGRRAAFAALALRPGLPTLANDRLTAEFGDRGLTALDSAEARPGYHVLEDRFAVVLDGRTYESGTLPSPSRTAAGDRVTYFWRADPYAIDVVYELKPGWRFVSKQIFVSTSKDVFHVDEVRVVDTDIAEPIDDVYVPKSANPTLLGTGDYGGFIRIGTRGLLAAVQNPFLEFTRRGQRFSVGYKPDFDWRSQDGRFASDRGLIAPYRLSGRRLPASMVPEWKVVEGELSSDGADEAEIEVFKECVEAFLLYKPARPLNVFVGWCVNDYQIDVADAAGRAEYKRIIDRAAELGAEYVLYAPSNSSLSRREASVDDWSWEHVLWLGLGQKLRKADWDPARDPVPGSIREMLDYAAAKRVKLLAYVYPVLPFAGGDWIVTKGNKQYASLGVRSWQDRLIDLLVAFHKRTGVGGYSFDHTFLRYPGTSSYAQWAGWRRVLHELRTRIPDIVVDGRQAYHLYGPWSWLAGSYPHPTFNDEQPESFIPFPDLHFDRVSADRERYTAYRYRNHEFAPAEIVPGFITHQTPRNDGTGEMPSVRTPDRGVVLTPIRARDWDYLGWRYSLLSSIAVGGWNNVINMIPARDEEEARNFSEADRKWFRDWIEWAEKNREYLRNTRTILGQPAIGRIDGTSAIVGDRGYVFLFNPNGRRLTATFALDLGSDRGQTPIRFFDPSNFQVGVRPRSDPRTRQFLLKELYPLENRLIAKPGVGPWTFGDRVSIEMDGQSALVLEVAPAGDVREPLVFGVPGAAALDANGVLTIDGARGEVGTTVEIVVVLRGRPPVTAVRVNKRAVAFAANGSVVRTSVRFAGESFHHAQQIGAMDPAFAGGSYSAAISIPKRIFDQVSARARAWPIRWTASDLRATWLAPARLLLHAQIAEPDDRWDAHLAIDGRPVDLLKAYTAIRPEKSTFVGFYADISHLAASELHQLELVLPTLRPGQFQGLFVDNVETEYTDEVAGR